MPAWQLALDPRVVDFGVNFGAPPAESSNPGWLTSWTPYVPSVVPPGKETGPPETTAPAASSMAGPDWYERLPDSTIAKLYAANPDAVRADLKDLLGWAPPQSTFQILARDRVLPDLVLIPSWIGSHLDDGERLWLDPSRLGEASKTLAKDCSSAEPIRCFYQDAVRTWRSMGFRVHPFGYDWRQPVEMSANRLYHLLKLIDTDSAVVIGHGLGGLIAMECAIRFRSGATLFPWRFKSAFPCTAVSPHRKPCVDNCRCSAISHCWGMN